MKFLAALLIAVLVSASVPVLVAAEDYEQEMWEIAADLACPVCSGQSIKDSNAPLARQIRALIMERLEAGQGRAEIVAFLVDRYGEGVQLDPPKSGFQIGVWLGPVVILAIGLAMAATVMLRRACAAPAVAGLEDYVARVDEDLAERREEG